MSGSFAPPAGPPPRAVSGSAPARQDSLDDALDEEPPPAYTSIAGPQGDTTIDAGPNRMDFSGPPPMPDRLHGLVTGTELPHHVTGVGEGYGRRFGAGSSPFGDQYQSPQNTGSPAPVHSVPSPAPGPSASGSGSFAAPAGPSPGKSNTSANGYSDSPQSPSAGPSRPPPPRQSASSIDLSPTETPTPGRPLLHNGQMLVYPKGFFCQKCYNTGYKANDPSNPHDADWRKYGKPYNSALAHSYSSSTSVDASSAANNFQRPLPNLPSAGPSSSYQSPAPPQQNPYGHLPPPPRQQGKWNSYPGHVAGGQSHQPPPPPPAPPHGYWGPPGGQMMSQPPMHQYGHMQPGAVVYQSGDPRIGGRLCWRCGGTGRETSFFGFDDGRCWECRGLGRVF